MTRVFGALVVGIFMAGTAAAQTVTDYYPQTGTLGTQVTVHITGLPAGADVGQLRLFLNVHELRDSVPTAQSNTSRLILPLVYTPDSQENWWSVLAERRVSLSVGPSGAKPFSVTAPELSEEDKREGARKFTIEPVVFNMYPRRGGIGTLVTFHVSGLRQMRAPNSPDALRLFVAGQPIPDSKPATIDLRNGRVSFYLEHTSASSRIWRDVLTWRERPLTVGWEKDGPLSLVDTSVHGSLQQFSFRPGTVRTVVFVIAFLIISAVFIYLAASTPLLRNAQLAPPISAGTAAQPTAFSLARCQMAWWTFLTMCASVLIWMLTGTLTLTPQVVVLIGISGATALGAVVIDASKQNSAASEARQEQSKAVAAEQAAAAADAQAAVNAGAANAVLLTEATAYQAEAVRHQARATVLERDASPPPAKGSLLTDLVSDSNGVSFHRFQILSWTVVLGLYFVSETVTTLAMPKLTDEMLTLLGISNSMYLGFKFPERRV
jgi:hypothetical protein